MKRKVNFILLGILGFFNLQGQPATYTYRRVIQGDPKLWNRVELPAEVLAKVTVDLADIRILGVKNQLDTIEAPYLVHILQEQEISKEIPFTQLNTTSNDRFYYFTLEVSDTEIVNEIHLAFDQKNFDLNVKLEGSQNQQEWFIIADNYRILSIKNENTQFSYTDIRFPDTRFRFYRLQISGNHKPRLISASVHRREQVPGNFNIVLTHPVSQVENKDHQTELTLNLKQTEVVSRIRLKVSDTVDFYRPFTLQCVYDSVKTENGWIYSYRNLASGILNSFEDTEFDFENAVTNRVRILIDNYNNEPLDIASIELLGTKYELIVRITEPAGYFLIYGNAYASPPLYDIRHFENKIPEVLTLLTLGSEEMIPKTPSITSKPLFENKYWLWLVMGATIVLLGFFSFRMMKNQG